MAAGTGSLRGNGTTFGLSSGSVGTITQLKIGKQSLAVIEDDSLAITLDHECIPGLLKSHEPCTGSAIFDPDTIIPLAGAVLTGTITFATRTGQTAGGTYAGTGFLISRDVTSLENDVRVLVDFEWQFDGKTGPAYTSGS